MHYSIIEKNESELMKLIDEFKVKGVRRLPGYKELASSIGTSYNSIFKVVKKLEGEGVLTVLAGEGVFIVDENLKGQNHRKIEFCPRLSKLINKSDLSDIMKKYDTYRFVFNDKNQSSCDFRIINNEELPMLIDKNVISRLNQNKCNELSIRIIKNIYSESLHFKKCYAFPIAVDPLVLGVDQKHIKNFNALENKSLQNVYSWAKTISTQNEAGKRNYGFDFVNKTSHTDALVRSNEANWHTKECFYKNESTDALECLWNMIHEVHTVFPAVSSRHPLKRIDRWNLSRVKAILCNYSDISILCKDLELFRNANKRLCYWGHESLEIYSLIKQADVSDELYFDILELLLSRPIQAKVLRHNWALPISLDENIHTRLRRAFGKSNNTIFTEILNNGHNPWKDIGPKSSYWKSEYLVWNVLNDLSEIEQWPTENCFS